MKKKADFMQELQAAIDPVLNKYAEEMARQAGEEEQEKLEDKRLPNGQVSNEGLPRQATPQLTESKFPALEVVDLYDQFFEFFNDKAKEAMAIPAHKTVTEEDVTTTCDKCNVQTHTRKVNICVYLSIRVKEKKQIPDAVMEIIKEINRLADQGAIKSTLCRLASIQTVRGPVTWTFEPDSKTGELRHVVNTPPERDYCVFSFFLVPSQLAMKLHEENPNLYVVEGQVGGYLEDVTRIATQEGASIPSNK